MNTHNSKSLDSLDVIICTSTMINKTTKTRASSLKIPKHHSIVSLNMMDGINDDKYCYNLRKIASKNSLTSSRDNLELLDDDV
jgi:hypothetical protein